MTAIEYIIRCMCKEDVPQVMDMMLEAKKQTSIHCINSCLVVDPEAFKVAVTKSGEIIGVCAAVAQHEDFVFVGMYVVRKKYQGRGIGYNASRARKSIIACAVAKTNGGIKQFRSVISEMALLPVALKNMSSFINNEIWKASLEHINNKNAGLNSVLEQEDKFRIRGGFPIIETEWVFVNNMSEVLANSESLSSIIPEGVDIQMFQDSHLPLIFSYDRDLMGYQRSVAIQLNCKEDDSQTLVALKDNICVGYGTIKLLSSGYTNVGPLYADSASIAEVMLKRLVNSFSQGKKISMLTISTNDSANHFAKEIGCKVVEHCSRLYRKKQFSVNYSKIFAMFDGHFYPY